MDRVGLQVSVTTSQLWFDVVVITRMGEICCEVTIRSTKVGYLMYLGNSKDVLLVLILSCCEDESMLLV